MSRTSSKLVIWLILGVVTGGGVLWYRSHNLSLRNADRFLAHEVQAKRVSDWRAIPLLPLNPASFSKLVKQSLASSELHGPSKSKPFLAKDLSQAQLLDLERAATGFLAAYSTGTSIAILSYMKDRGEQLSAAHRQELKDILAKDRAFTATQLEKLKSDSELLGVFWQQAKCNPRWQMLLNGDANSCLWLGNKNIIREAFSEFGVEDKEVFHRSTRINHLFEPAVPLDELIEEECLFADFKFVVQHDKQLFNEPAPYYVRFIYDKRDQRWHPIDLVRIGTVASQNPFVVF
jgi:hypothetical protein